MNSYQTRKDGEEISYGIGNCESNLPKILVYGRA